MIKSVHGKKMTNDIIGTDKATWSKINIKDNRDSFLRLIDAINKEKQEIDKCGGEIAIEKQHSKGKMTARERINYLLDA